MVKIRYYGILRPNMPSKEADGFWYSENDGRTIAEVLEMTGASDKEFGMTILVNKVRKETDYVLQDGDVMTVMPLIAGG